MRTIESRLTIAMPSALFEADNFERMAIGRGGNVEIYTNSLEVRNSASLQASTLGEGNAGNVIIHADDRVAFDNGTASSTVEAGGVGNGDSVEIYTNSLEVQNGAQLAASTKGRVEQAISRLMLIPFL